MVLGAAFGVGETAGSMKAGGLIIPWIVSRSSRIDWTENP